MAELRYPQFVGARAPGYWLRLCNLLAGRQGFFRVDYLNEWRYAFGAPEPADRMVSIGQLLAPGNRTADGFRIVFSGEPFPPRTCLSQF
jgi:hypothetical protein